MVCLLVLSCLSSVSNSIFSPVVVLSSPYLAFSSTLTWIPSVTAAITHLSVPPQYLCFLFCHSHCQVLAVTFFMVLSCNSVSLWRLSVSVYTILYSVLFSKFTSAAFLVSLLNSKISPPASCLLLCIWVLISLPLNCNIFSFCVNAAEAHFNRNYLF